MFYRCDDDYLVRCFELIHVHVLLYIRQNVCLHVEQSSKVRVYCASASS